MKGTILAALATVGLLLGGGRVDAAPLLEDFETDFPEWETRWLGLNSNLENYYVMLGNGHNYRGNNPDGLWVSDADAISDDPLVTIAFAPDFGLSLTSFSVDIAGYVPMGFRVFDSGGATLLSVPMVAATMGAYTDPGTYVNYAVSSSNGIGGFEFSRSGSQVEGNTSIDNVRVNTGGPPTQSVPEPASLTLMGLGMAGVLAGRFRSKTRP
jgi:hypothetical protein